MPKIMRSTPVKIDGVTTEFRQTGIDRNQNMPWKIVVFNSSKNITFVLFIIGIQARIFAPFRNIATIDIGHILHIYWLFQILHTISDFYEKIRIKGG